MKKSSKIIAGSLAVLMLAATGCTRTGGESSTGNSSSQESQNSVVQTDGYAFEATKDPVTLSIYVDDPGSLWETWGSDPVSQRVTDLTGISFECIAPDR